MRLTRRQLKRLINEAMKSVYGVSDSLALMTNYNNSRDNMIIKADDMIHRRYDFVLYDPSAVYNDISNLSDDSEESLGNLIIKNTKGIITVKEPKPETYANHGAWIVSNSAAIESYGPTIYDLVMAASPAGLTADNSSVSEEARSLWSYYANKRGDVLKIYLDNMKAPLTPSKFDDKFYYHSAGANTGLGPATADHKPFQPVFNFNREIKFPDYLYMAYFSNKQIGEYELLVDNHEKFIDILRGHDSYIGRRIDQYYDTDDAISHEFAYFKLRRSKSPATTIAKEFFAIYYY